MQLKSICSLHFFFCVAKETNYISKNRRCTTCLMPSCSEKSSNYTSLSLFKMVFVCFLRFPHLALIIAIFCWCGVSGSSVQACKQADLQHGRQLEPVCFWQFLSFVCGRKTLLLFLVLGSRSLSASISRCFHSLLPFVSTHIEANPE